MQERYICIYAVTRSGFKAWFISTSFDASSGKGDSRGLTMRHLMQASSRETSYHAQYMARAVLLSGTTLLDVIS